MSVRVVHGANDGRWEFVGKTICEVRRLLNELYNLHPALTAWVNGIPCDDATVLQEGDNLEFGRVSGEKGGVQDFWTESEVAELFGASALSELEKAGIRPCQVTVFSKSQISNWQQTRSQVASGCELANRPVFIDFSTMTLRVTEGEFLINDQVRYRLLACLARRPNHYWMVDTLKREVWDDVHGETADATVSREMRRLTSSLRDLGITSIWPDSKRHRHALLTT